jgi:hypothetical protein
MFTAQRIGIDAEERGRGLICGSTPSTALEDCVKPRNTWFRIVDVSATIGFKDSPRTQSKKVRDWASSLGQRNPSLSCGGFLYSEPFLRSWMVGWGYKGTTKSIFKPFTVKIQNTTFHRNTANSSGNKFLIHTAFISTYNRHRVCLSTNNMKHRGRSQPFRYTLRS